MSISWDEQCKRDQGWTLAREYYISNGGAHEITDSRAKLCIESRDYSSMNDSCWEAVKTQYPIEI